MRDQIGALSRVLHQQAVETTGSDADADVLAVVADGGLACVNLAMIRGGRHLGDKANFPARSGEAADAAEVLEAFISQHYAVAAVSADDRSSMPTSMRRSWRRCCPRRAAGGCRSVRHPQEQPAALAGDGRGERAAGAGAHGWPKRVADGAHARAARGARARIGDDDADKLRIECFDISHTAGEATQASCVVYANHQMRPGGVPALQHRGHRARRRLRGDAPGAVAPLRRVGARRGRDAGPGADRRRQGAGGGRAPGLRGTRARHRPCWSAWPRARSARPGSRNWCYPDERPPLVLGRESQA